MKPLGNISLVWSFQPKADVKGRAMSTSVVSRMDDSRVRHLRVVNRGRRPVDIWLIGNLVTVGCHAGIGEPLRTEYPDRLKGKTGASHEAKFATPRPDLKPIP